jgi:hypothetical protein
MPLRRKSLLAAGLALPLLLLLAWFGVIPGGWTLRGWIEPHAERRAREQAEYSSERLAEFRRENGTAPAGSIVFLGSSTIERFPLRSAFPERPCLDRGIGDETTDELLDRLDASLPDAPPAGVVLYVASVDFRRAGRSPEVIKSRLETIVRRLRARDPALPIALIGILSERGATPEFVARLAATNARLEGFAQANGLAFVRTDRAPITLPSGALSEECSVDRLHLSEEGYRHLARWLLEDGGDVAQFLAP